MDSLCFLCLLAAKRVVSCSGPSCAASEVLFSVPVAALERVVQPFHQGLIVAMRGHVRGDASSDRETEKIEVADQVQNLVAHEFIRIPQFGIDDLAVVHDDMGMQVPAADLAELLGHFDVLKRIEGAGRGDLFCKGTGFRVERMDLLSDRQRVVNPHRDLEPVKRFRKEMFFVLHFVSHADLLADHRNLGQCGLCLYARLFDQFAEVLGRAVHIRDFFFYLDQRIGYAVHGEDCHQMFDRAHSPPAIVQGGGIGRKSLCGRGLGKIFK